MAELKDIVSLEPDFESRAGFYAVGLAGEFSPGATRNIGALWEQFVPRIQEIPGLRNSATYGLCLPPGVGNAPGQFTYVAAFETSSLDDIPEGMTGVDVGAAHYAVFTYRGGLGPDLPRAMNYIFETWLPASGYSTSGPDFEYYTDEFDPVKNTGHFYIYVPLKQE